MWYPACDRYTVINKLSATLQLTAYTCWKQHTAAPARRKRWWCCHRLQPSPTIMGHHQCTKSTPDRGSRPIYCNQGNWTAVNPLTETMYAMPDKMPTGHVRTSHTLLGSKASQATPHILPPPPVTHDTVCWCTDVTEANSSSSKGPCMPCMTQRKGEKSAASAAPLCCE
jgi:hypothetical protein